ncbi:MAG: thiamine-phosphate pyrophosphorylase [Elusimicrobiota bacterium]
MDKKIARLLDANVNRACEGLRVVEDTARFQWNDKKLYAEFRACRHKLHDLTQRAYKFFITARESNNDVGRIIKEGKRTNMSSVMIANMKRAQEAARVLEEYGKIFSPQHAQNFKAVRYKLYSLEKKVFKKL